MEVTKLSTTYFAFCYPYSYTECQHYILSLEEAHFLKKDIVYNKTGINSTTTDILFSKLYRHELFMILKT
jgi:hypothetical protein